MGDKYNEEARIYLNKFRDNRHDQSLLSVASKILNNYLAVGPVKSISYFKATRIRGSRYKEFVSKIDKDSDKYRLSVAQIFCSRCEYVEGKSFAKQLYDMTHQTIGRMDTYEAL